MKTIAITNSIIKGRKNNYYIGKKIKHNDDVVGEVLNASVNKKFKRVYMDIEIDDEFDNPKFNINVNILQNPTTKRYSLVLTQTKIKRRYVKRK